MNRMRTALLLAALTLAPLGCQKQFSQILPEVGVVPIDGLDRPIPGDAAPALDIQNHRGSVTVVVDPEAGAPSVTALPHVSGPVEAKVRWTAASMQEDNGRPVLRVLSTPDDTGAPDVPVNLTITVPACGGVRVQNDGGPVTLRNVSGAIEVHTGLGANDGRAITIDTPYALTDPMLLRAERGSVDIRMGRESAGQLTATTQHGRVTADTGRAKITGVKLSRSSWTGTVNGGSSDQRIDVERGDVHVRIDMEDPVTLPVAHWLERD